MVDINKNNIKKSNYSKFKDLLTQNTKKLKGKTKKHLKKILVLGATGFFISSSIITPINATNTNANSNNINNLSSQNRNTNNSNQNVDQLNKINLRREKLDDIENFLNENNFKNKETFSIKYNKIKELNEQIQEIYDENIDKFEALDKKFENLLEIIVDGIENNNQNNKNNISQIKDFQKEYYKLINETGIGKLEKQIKKLNNDIKRDFLKELKKNGVNDNSNSQENIEKKSIDNNNENNNIYKLEKSEKLIELESLADNIYIDNIEKFNKLNKKFNKEELKYQKEESKIFSLSKGKNLKHLDNEFNKLNKKYEKIFDKLDEDFTELEKQTGLSEIYKQINLESSKLLN